MKYKYKMFKIKNQCFVVKMDYNPLTSDFEYHMYIRDLITPQQAIAAYFQKPMKIIMNNMTDMKRTVKVLI